MTTKQQRAIAKEARRVAPRREEPRVTVYLIATEAETYVHIPRKRQEDEIGGILA